MRFTMAYRSINLGVAIVATLTPSTPSTKSQTCILITLNPHLNTQLLGTVSRVLSTLGNVRKHVITETQDVAF